MIKEKLKAIVEDAIEKTVGKDTPAFQSAGATPVLIEKPRHGEHGDFACGVALKLASIVRQSPLRIAETIAEKIELGQDCRLEVAAPGFINFYLGTAWLETSLQEILKAGNNFGKSAAGHGQRVLVEYVSANPTGDLHIGHGRGAVYGSCLSNLLAFAGYEVEQEFYVNDTGEQMSAFGQCAWACYQRLLGRTVSYPEDGYPEESISPFVRQVIEDKDASLLSLNAQSGQEALAQATSKVIIDWQRQLLSRLRIKFDRWQSELALHERGTVTGALSALTQKGMTYVSDGALWLKARELGDERDRVLKKSGGATTYLAADAAYHLDKYGRGYDRLVTIWGADHHGQVPGLKAAVQALGADVDKLEVILTQIVNLQRDGQMVRMSKRMGTVVTLAEVLDEVGVDAVRYYLAESNPNNPINFDLALAKQTSRENPAFYIQYAHARCCAILRKALEPSLDVESQKQQPALITDTDWAQYMTQYKENSQVFAPLFVDDPEVFACQKALIMRLEGFPEEVEEAARTRIPGHLAHYAYNLACDLQRFYESCRVISNNKDVTKARLGLIAATRQVLSNVLGILGVSAPERM